MNLGIQTRLYQTLISNDLFWQGVWQIQSLKVFCIYKQWKDFRKADLKTTYSKSHKNEVFKYNLVTSSYQSSQRDLFQLFILFRWSDREILRNWISNLATKISSTNKKTRKSTDVKKKQHMKKYFLLPVNRPTSALCCNLLRLILNGVSSICFRIYLLFTCHTLKDTILTLIISLNHVTVFPS